MNENEAVQAAAQAIWRHAEHDIAGRIDRESCDRVARRAIRAAVSYLTQHARVLPGVDQVAEAVRGVQGVPFVGSKQRKIAAVVLALFAAQPTEAQVARAAAERAWWEGVNDQWKHRPIGVRLNEFDNPYRPSMGDEPHG